MCTFFLPLPRRELISLTPYVWEKHTVVNSSGPKNDTHTTV